jgi:hypothetical protein
LTAEAQAEIANCCRIKRTSDLIAENAPPLRAKKRYPKVPHFNGKSKESFGEERDRMTADLSQIPGKERNR